LIHSEIGEQPGGDFNALLFATVNSRDNQRPPAGTSLDEMRFDGPSPGGRAEPALPNPLGQPQIAGAPHEERGNPGVNIGIVLRALNVGSAQTSQ
jgi:hypothetical protein